MSGEKPRESKDEVNIDRNINEREIPDEKIVSEQEVLTKEKIEDRLSPEIIEKIMEKVQDINQIGTTFSVLINALREADYKTLKSVFQSGLLGAPWRGGFTTHLTKEEWAKRVRQNKDAIVWFSKLDNDQEKIKSKFFVQDRPVVAIIFDLKHFEEKEEQMLYELQQKSRTYRPSSGGNILSYRIPPRFFKGLVLNLRDSKKGEKGILLKFEDRTHEEYIKKAEEIVNQLLPDDKKNYLTPIYDKEGSLLWPQQMSYEEVKKFVEERDEKKAK